MQGHCNMEPNMIHAIDTRTADIANAAHDILSALNAECRALEAALTSCAGNARHAGAAALKTLEDATDAVDVLALLLTRREASQAGVALDQIGRIDRAASWLRDADGQPLDPAFAPVIDALERAAQSLDELALSIAA
jgi:uncharacterized protein YukE